MNAQPSLFPGMAPAQKATDICVNRHQHNPESMAANKNVQSSKANLQSQIFDFVRSCGERGATTEEISRILNIRYTTASARVSELRADKRLFKKGTRPTSTGSSAAVLVTP